MLFIAVLFLVLTKILTSDNTTELSMSLRSSEHVRLCTHRHIYKTWSSFCAVGRAVHILPQIPCLFTTVVIETLQLALYRPPDVCYLHLCVRVHVEYVHQRRAFVWPARLDDYHFYNVLF